MGTRRRVGFVAGLAMLSLLAAGCHGWEYWQMHVVDPQDLVFKREGRHCVVNGCEVYAIGVEIPGRPGWSQNKTLWAIYSPRILIWEDFEFKYGELPSGFEQVFPPGGGLPEPLQEGGLYRISAGWWEGASVDPCGGIDKTVVSEQLFKWVTLAFRIENGVPVPETDSLVVHP